MKDTKSTREIMTVELLKCLERLTGEEIRLLIRIAISMAT